MKIDEKDLNKIQKLVGNITEDNLKYVDCSVSKNMGIFIPSVGFCEYAITPQHSHPSYSFVIFFSEKQSIVPIEIEVLPNHYLATAMSPKVLHEEKETEVFTRYIAILISEEFYNSQYNIYSDKVPDEYLWNQFQVSEDIITYIKRYMNEYEDKNIGCEKVLEGLEAVITHDIIRSILNINNADNIKNKKLGIEKVLEYMQQNFGEKLSVSDLAKFANMSESHFIRTFKKETKLSPMEYLIKLRIDKTKKLLRSNNKIITEIAIQCGFNSSSHFSTCFSKQTGITPKEYQNSYLKTK
ncbi:MAG: AraC family transcriptional regulator [Clostridiaceae bacterium]